MLGVETALPQRGGLCVFQLLSNNVVNDLVLLETLMDSMTARQRDSLAVVRMLALRGLGNVALGSPEKVRAPGFGWPRGVSQARLPFARLLSWSPSLRAAASAPHLEMRSEVEVHQLFPGQENGGGSSSNCCPTPLATVPLLLQQSSCPSPRSPRGRMVVAQTEQAEHPSSWTGHLPSAKHVPRSCGWRSAADPCPLSPPPSGRRGRTGPSCWLP